jgi:hypothetical protein
MKRIRDPIFALTIYIIGFLLISGVFYFGLEESERTLINYFSIMGTYSSVYGIIVAYVQILSVKETTENTEQRVEDANKRVMKMLSISDISKAIKTVHEIQNYLISNKDESSIIRLKDLKSILIQLKYNSEIGELTDSNDFTDSLATISIHMENLNYNLIGTKTGLNKGKIISDLEIIENQLNEFEGLLKFGKHD